MSKPPIPETKVALLPSFGYGPGVPRITKHVYSRTLECVLPAPDGDAFEYLYKCTETGVERRWGTYERDEEEALS
jgi:hypothetical protein